MMIKLHVLTFDNYVASLSHTAYRQHVQCTQGTCNVSQVSSVHCVLVITKTFNYYLGMLPQAIVT